MSHNKEHIETLITSLDSFIKLDGVNISSESFEHVTITISGSLEILEYLQTLYTAFSDISNEESFLEDSDGVRVELSDIKENIETSYTDFNWQISISKTSLFKLSSQTVSCFFDINNFLEWLKKIDIFDCQHEFLKHENIQIVLPMYTGEKVIGRNFIITAVLQDEWVCKNDSLLPTDSKVKEHIHVVSNDAITLEPQKFVFEMDRITEEFESVLLLKYAESLLSTIVQTFHSKDEVTIKGLKHLKLKINNSNMPDLEIVKLLEKTVVWAYEENTSTRLQLLADRLSFHEHKEKSLMEIIIKHLQEAFVEAQDRYQFVVTAKSEEYTKDLRDLLKDTKEKTDKYSDKTRNIIGSLLRDALGSVFFLGLTAYSRFSSKGDFIFSSDAELIFTLLGSYFLLSMITQAAFNFWDIYLSKTEAHKWSESSMDYMTKETYDKFVTTPLNKRTGQFMIVQWVIICIYTILSVLAFNVQYIAKNMFDMKPTFSSSEQKNTKRDVVIKINKIDIELNKK